ncbi:cellulose biosynthesis protein BcsE [Lonsdalea quercina]|uniref:cellulose biosynthesis protein BcsE n=2 Tax=Lonsdalea quercina TaxID=71657 RepID=UPI003974F17B
MKYFSMLGIEQVPDELMVMQPAGCYWVTVQRQEDAIALARQVMGAQAAVTLLSSATAPQELLTPPLTSGPDRIPMYSLPQTNRALLKLDKDFLRLFSSSSNPQLVLFYTEVSDWDKLTSSELSEWLKRIKIALKKKKISLLIITYGRKIISLGDHLHGLFCYLNGFSCLEYQKDNWKYRIHWWYNATRLLADRQLALNFEQNRFSLMKQDEKNTPLTLNDEHIFIAERSVLEGAPPLSNQWQLHDGNERVYAQAEGADSATVIFCLSHNDQTGGLARHIHRLRSLRGTGLKIVVREMEVGQRQNDERLLLACGVNIIVPFGTSLSRFLMMLEGLQGQRYQRYVPKDFSVLRKLQQPLRQKGFMPLETFCHTVTLLMNDPLLPENSKGVLVALTPVSQLRAEQALTLCKTRRNGDVFTVMDNCLYIFLFSCNLHDLKTALASIFPLPYDEMFSDRQVWCEDLPILSEIRLMGARAPRTHTPATAAAASAMKTTSAPPAPRRVPQRIALAQSKGEAK